MMSNKTKTLTIMEEEFPETIEGALREWTSGSFKSIKNKKR